jgi:hypothetical protein
MTSWRQFQANRLNALKSTGPQTEEGRRISRRNALRDGLTAETVIDRLEDSEDYRGFEAAIVADYLAETAVEARTRAPLCVPAVAPASNNLDRDRPVPDPGRNPS